MALVKFIPWLPALAAILCGICCMRKQWRENAAWICIGSIAMGFVLSVMASFNLTPGTKPDVVHFFDWIEVDGLVAHMSYYIDPLTILMLFVVTGVGTLVAIYAAGYMKGDKGYARFFFGVSLFIFAMTTLVMADNLVLLYLGWEGVGLCSYLLIGFYYNKPSAVAAAKKAFIVNRIGDLAFALGIFLTYRTFGTVEYSVLFTAIDKLHGHYPVEATLIPFLLMLGAFGKSAQIPLYIWLPDAMEGPTPVSALIHAATMVTAGVYMIARLLPLFVLSSTALPTVALIGTATAFYAASIALCQYDIKRVFAYSTISQLGYMFLGLGVLSTSSAVFHLFTHAFFKALLFLTAGSVMHALTGQLDMRKMSGLRKKMPITCWLMFIGCWALAGLPPFAGFFSKDAILAAAVEKGINTNQWFYLTLAGIGLLTALMTAYYTFRLWFRVFLGPLYYEMGDDHHDAPEDVHGETPGQEDHAHHEPHEMPLLMNAPLMVLAIGSIFAGGLGGWISKMIADSSASVHVAQAAHGNSAVHLGMMFVSSLIAVIGVAIAAYFHWFNRPAGDAVGRDNANLVHLIENKYFVDEVLDRFVVRPLRGVGYACFIIDQLIIDGLVMLVGLVPRLLGLTVQPTQRGALQGYGLGMLSGAAVLIMIVLWLM